MAKTKKKLDAKAFANQRRKRRQWLTFMRMVRYGVNNFSRNAWLTVAATAVMTITLLIIFATFVARSVLTDTVSSIRQKVDVSVYVKPGIDQADVKKITADIKNLSTVDKVSYVSPDQARQNFAQANSTDSNTLNALNQATSQFPGTFSVNLKDINDTDQLEHFVSTDPTLKKDIDPNLPPSYAGTRKTAIQNIGRWTDFAQKVGLVASVIFIAISSLIIFNTIRMAIFNRRDEIQMMKLIGADRNFIRGPFVVEAIVYGCIAAIIATGLGMAILYSMHDKLASYGVAIDNTLSMMTMFVAVVLVVMMLLGAMIGVISSLLATRRYLKI